MTSSKLLIHDLKESVLVEAEKHPDWSMLSVNAKAGLAASLADVAASNVDFSVKSATV